MSPHDVAASCARSSRRECAAARAAGAAPRRRAGPRDRGPGHRDALRDRHHQAGAAGRRGTPLRYVSVDGGMSDNIRTALYDAELRPACSPTAAPTHRPRSCRVVGKHCESGDILVRDAWLPSDVAPGDLLAVAATGAYCWSMASNYNHLPARRWSPCATARPRDRPAQRLSDVFALDAVLADLPAALERPRERPLKVALLGCGTVGSEVLRLIDEQSADLAARIGTPVEVAGIAVRAPDHHPRVPAHLLTTDADALVAARRRRPRRRGDRRHRARPRRSCSRRSRPASRWSARTRRCWPRTARRCTQRGDAPASTSTTRRRRRRDPAAAPAARVAGRRPDPPRRWGSSTAPPTTSCPAWPRRAPASPRRWPRPPAGLRRGRPDRRRRRLRRRGEGRDPRVAGLPHPR